MRSYLAFRMTIHKRVLQIHSADEGCTNHSTNLEVKMLAGSPDLHAGPTEWIPACRRTEATAEWSMIQQSLRRGGLRFGTIPFQVGARFSGHKLTST
jgi:hypothetical protein